jgi:hypothetical protein
MNLKKVGGVGQNSGISLQIESNTVNSTPVPQSLAHQTTPCNQFEECTFETLVHLVFRGQRPIPHHLDHQHCAEDSDSGQKDGLLSVELLSILRRIERPVCSHCIFGTTGSRPEHREKAEDQIQDPRDISFAKMFDTSRFLLSFLLVLGVGSVSAFMGVPPLRSASRQMNAAQGVLKLAKTGCERRQRHGVVMQTAGSGAGGGNKNAEVRLLDVMCLCA